MEKLIAAIESDRHHIEHLVNASGTFAPLSFLDHKPEDYDKYITLNRALFFVTQAVARNMKQNGGGAIVNIGSMWAQQAIKATPSSAYSMAKAGLHSLTQHLAMELAADKIRVNAVSPAVVRTPVYEGFIPKDQLDNVMKSFDAFHPIGRIGTARDVAAAVTSLAFGSVKLDDRSHHKCRRRSYGRPKLTTRQRSWAGSSGPSFFARGLSATVLVRDVPALRIAF